MQEPSVNTRGRHLASQKQVSVATFTSMRWQYDICIMALDKPCNIFLHGLACATRCPMESV